MTPRRSEILDALKSALGDDASLIHPTYSHLQRPMTIARLTVVQWLVIASGILATWLMHSALPFSDQTSLSVAGTVVGVPSTVVFFLISQTEFNARAVLRSLWVWRRDRALLLPGPPTQMPDGYELLAPPTTARSTAAPPAAEHLGEDLWA
jgi:hypothetical protein